MMLIFLRPRRRLISFACPKDNPQLSGNHPFWYTGQKKKPNLGRSRKPFYRCSQDITPCIATIKTPSTILQISGRVRPTSINETQRNRLRKLSSRSLTCSALSIFVFLLKLRSRRSFFFCCSFNIDSSNESCIMYLVISTSRVCPNR
jgi:hypothetical protein